MTQVLAIKFDQEQRDRDTRKYVIMSLNHKDVCPLVTGALGICKSGDHKHEVVTRQGYDAACDYVTHMRESGWEVKVMDRVN